MRARHVRCPDLEGHWREARERPGGERKVTGRYAAFQVLVLDEWLLDRPDELFRGFLPGLMEARHGTASTVFRAQFRQKDWHARLGGGVHADAIMDRIVHGAAWVGMGETSMRRKLGGDSGQSSCAGAGRGADPCRGRCRFAMLPVLNRDNLWCSAGQILR